MKILVMMKSTKAFRKYCSEQTTCLTTFPRVDVIARRFFRDFYYSKIDSVSSEAMITCSDLPEDILFEIFRYLDRESLLRAALVCRR